ncbi:hypothetical protein scyTo_0025572, partial [Scyliorhinus torazame]|nr:hypothetical protein [Scyliorhinus torazame]
MRVSARVWASVSRKAPDFSSPAPDNRLSLLPLGEVESEIVSILQASGTADPESVPRPLSPTRLQPVSLPDTESIRDMEELLEIRAAIPRALKKRTSIDLPPTQLGPMQKRANMYQELTKLFSRNSQRRQLERSEGAVSPAPLAAPSPTSPASNPDLQETLPSPVLESPTSSPTYS